MSTAIERAESRRLHAACENACKVAKTSASALWDALAEVHRLEAHKVLGYGSFTAWAKVELDVSDRQSYRYLSKVREIAAISEQTGLSAGEAAEQVPLTPPSAPNPQPQATTGTVEVVDSWERPTKALKKVTASISHLKTVPLTSAARIALEELLESIQAML